MFHVRAAVSLNNIAVGLLERKCFAQASETLKDALEALKSSPWVGGETTETDEPGQALATRHQKATNRLMNPEPSQSIIQLVVVSSESLSAMALARTKQGPISREACAIRIEFCEDEAITDNLTTETAIMLYNLSVSYLCLSAIPSTSWSSSQRVSMSLMASSYQLLMTHHAECAADSIRTYRLLSLEVIVLGNLLAILSDMHMAEQLRAMSGQYKLLQASMEWMEGLEECFQKGQDMAAAA